MSKKSHDYGRFASNYSELGLENTYYLAFRDIPSLLETYTQGLVTLDHGCGAGRSSRFLQSLGYTVTGADMSLDMLQQARSRDPDGRYEQLHSSSLPFDDATFDLVFQSCVAEEIPGIALMNEIFSEISRVLKRSGVVVVVTRDGAIGSGEWSSFVITEPEDGLRSGGQVKLFIREKNITLLDYVWFHSDFESVFDKSGLKILERHQPIATGEEPYHWYQELDKSFWNIYVLRKVADSTM